MFAPAAALARVLGCRLAKDAAVPSSGDSSGGEASSPVQNGESGK
jgi:hypothetical protein